MAPLLVERPCRRVPLVDQQELGLSCSSDLTPPSRLARDLGATLQGRPPRKSCGWRGADRDKQ